MILGSVRRTVNIVLTATEKVALLLSSCGGRSVVVVVARSWRTAVAIDRCTAVVGATNTTTTTDGRARRDATVTMVMLVAIG